MKKILLKVLSVSLVIMQIVSFTSFAAIQSESSSSGNYFWYENFASESNKLKPAKGATVTYNTAGANSSTTPDGSNTVTTTNGKFGFVSLGEIDFTKGPILLSYKIKASAATKAWGALHIGSPDVDMVVMPKLWDGNKIMGLEKNNASADLAQNTVVGNENGLKETASASTYKLNTWHIIQVLLDYDFDNKILTVNQFADSKPLLRTDGTQFSYKLKRASGMDDAMKASMTFRFYVGSGKTASIDDLMIRQEGNISFDNGAFITVNKDGVDTKSTALSIVDDANYDDKTFTYQKSVNTTTADDYTLTRYTADDKLLLNGTKVTTQKTASYPGSILFNNLERSATTDFFIFKLTNPDAVKSFSGGTVKNPYGLLHSGTTTPVRETHLYNANNTKVTLVNGKLPSETKKLEFTLSYKDADIEADSVKIEGGGISKVSQKLDNVYTIDLDENDLATGTEYTITVGDVKKTYTTTGEKPAREFAMAECANLDPENFTNSDSTNVTLTKQSDGLLYTSNRTTGLGNVSYKFNDTFDFTKGAMLVSVDITYNQDMTWIGDVGQLFLPNMYLGSKNIGYITGIQHYGVYGRSADGGRVKVTDAKGKANTVKKGDKVTLRGLFEYKSDEGKIYYTQFADDRRLYKDSDGSVIVIPAYSVDVTEDVLGQNPVLQFQGRLFKDGGLIINNITVTTVNGITADDVLTFTNGTATAEIKSSVNFAQDAPVIATAPQYTNSAAKSDFTVTKYTSSDKLHLNGTAVTDFTYAAESGKFTIGKLASDGEYVIELSDKTKISDIAENAIDTSIFTTGSAGLLKTTVLNGENKEMTIGADGKIPTNAKKIKFEFTKDYVTSGVSLGGKSASEENGAYTFDFSSDALESNKTYTLTVNGANYGTFTTGDGVFAVNQPSITADGFGSVYIQNTTSADKTVYIIHAGYKADGLLTGVVYEKITAGAGTSETYTMTKKPELTNAQTQKVFVWENFATLYPLAEEFTK